MNQVKIDISSLNIKQEKIKEEVIVGKDILDLITTSMYVNPLNVYREYIQNAADAIDLAKEKNLDFDDEPSVKISFDHGMRSVKIIDNGISLSQDDFLKRILSIGGSNKRGTNLRGFRGVGRLSGLGYCQKLIFRGRLNSNEDITELTWDGRILRQKYRDQTYTASLGELIKDITESRTFNDDSYPGRFFEVEMFKISRLKNDVLLNEKLICDYLGQVAPVDFKEDFIFKNEVNKFLEKYNLKNSIKIFIDGYGEVFKPHSNEISFTDFLKDKFSNVYFKEFLDSDNNLLAVCWYLDHNYYGSIPKQLSISGLRLRSGNIQVGDENITAQLFPESRFSGWVVGDIHILSPEIIPNGRRDEFEPNAKYNDLQNQIVIFTKEFGKLIRDKSNIRNQAKSFELKFDSIQRIIDYEYSDPDPIIDNALREYSLENISLIEALTDRNLENPEIIKNINEKIKLKKAALNVRFKLCDISKSDSNKSKLIRKLLDNSKDFENTIHLSKEILNFLK